MSEPDRRPDPLLQIPPDISSVSDYEAYAKERLSPGAWAYLNGASADGLTAVDNVAAFQRIRLFPRVLQALKGGHTRVSLPGLELEAPILVAPVAHQKLAHPEGELATILGVSAVRAGMVVSTQASTRFDQIIEHSHVPLWFQLYIQPDRAFTEHLVHQAADLGYRALVLTVDAPVSGLRNQEQRAGFVMPDHARAVNLDAMQRAARRPAGAGESAVFGSGLLDGIPTWDDLHWLIERSPLPVLLKGILHPADAERAIDAGAAGIIVSNHGGRSLDTVPATIDALPAVAQAVRGRTPVLMDGGIRRGADIFKAIALGAAAVLVGRPVMHGLAAAGPTGVAHVLHLLRSELEVTMALAGCRSLADIGPEALWQAGAGGPAPLR